jgi:uncharacterized protein involved in type VI secretion and phage assembly
MEIKQTENLNVELSKFATASTYVHGWGETVDFDFTDTGSDGVQHNVEVKVPLELARNLAEELVNDIAAYDKTQAEKKAEAEAEEAEKVAEELGVEDVGA